MPYFNSTDGAISQFRRTKTSYCLWRYSTKTGFLLGVHVDQHLTWKTHVDHVLSSSYGTLSVLRRLKHLAPFPARKHLAESLLLSKVSYACSVFLSLPAFQMKRLQRLQNACTGFVTRRFAGVEDVIKQNQEHFSTRQQLFLISSL